MLSESALDIIEELDQWLDGLVSRRYIEQPLAQDWARVAKLAEEAGEAVDALIGCTEQNPRKGAYGSEEDVLKELADVAMTAMYAIQHFTKDKNRTARIISLRAIHHRDRIQQ